MEFWKSQESGLSSNFTLTRLSITASRVAAGDSVTLSLRRALADGSGAAVTLQTATAAISTPFSTTVSTFSAVVDPAYVYWLELTLDPLGGSSDAEVATV